MPVNCGAFFKYHWRGVVVFLTPIVLLPIFLTNNIPEYRCMYIMLTMSTYWITEAIPLAVTSMIPIVAFPVAGIMDSEETCKHYFKDTLVLFIAGIMIALAIEYCNLHKRIALRVLQLVGCTPRRLHFGLVSVTMFLSMWTSNSAATSMMCPIIKGVIEELEAQGLCRLYREEEVTSENTKGELEEPYPSKITICFFLGTAYASSIGGMGTLMGTPTNLAFKGIYESRFPNTTDTVDFPSFMFYVFPAMIVCTFLMYLYLQWFYMGLWRPNSKEAQEANIGKEGEVVAKRVIDERYMELGPMTCHEISVLIIFVTMIVSFFTRKPGFVNGWGDWLNTKEVKNSSAALLAIILYFVLPVNWLFLRCFSQDYKKAKTNSLLSWKYLQDKTPWGLIFVIGSGFALAEGSKVSGLAALLGNALSGVKNLPPVVILLIVIMVAEFLTAFSTNVAICNIIVPILAEISIAVEVHPLYLIIPAGLACSMAFHLPVSTTPNALVAGYAKIRSKDMIIAGIGPTLSGIIVLFILCQTWAFLVYPNLLTFPDWAKTTD